jgi:hypothetical protein
MLLIIKNLFEENEADNYKWCDENKSLIDILKNYESK